MKAISSTELREMYQQFFETKEHTRIPSAPLTPEHDPSVLFTTAGMHPLVPYLKGQPHPQGQRLTNVQKCLRTTDIDAVGDATHATVFEMLGNWSLGDYFKREAIAWSWEFLTNSDWLAIDPSSLAVSVFAGDVDSPRDTEAAAAWQAAGVALPRIAFLDKQENWWPTGGGATGPQGPDTEMFYWTGSEPAPADFNPEDKQWVEIWNDVFMQYNRGDDGTLTPLPQQNVDTGMGLERTVMVLNGLSSIYDIDSYQKLMRLIKKHTLKEDVRHQRIVADHMKAATFIFGDEHPVEPANMDRGYVLRRIVRRGVRSAKQLGIPDIGGVLAEGVTIMTSEYQAAYPSLARHLPKTLLALQREVVKFEAVITQGLKNFEKFAASQLKGGVLAGDQAFRLYESYGFPIELTQELARERGITVDMGGFEVALRSHQETSRAGAKQKFAGGLADHSEKSVQYHTATHLLHQALQEVLGDHARQRGSNITPERLRFDFVHPNKMTAEEIARVEKLINEQIAADLPVQREEMTFAQAKEKGALGLFEEKYGERVSVYSIGEAGSEFSIEICGGPHVTHTGELGHFKILKEESAGAGIRRIKAVLE